MDMSHTMHRPTIGEFDFPPTLGLGLVHFVQPGQVRTTATRILFPIIPVAKDCARQATPTMVARTRGTCRRAG
ncbi:hypothetical protein [Pandoravirus japonicus]|uniref:Uncharacterized protein n=1 Tax=Pandoravirus japonicus TaxID=2823154 RepID=A0A811BPK0_9VIRU|nr:hypothetical protein [Pandoravirus japonicus]